MTDLQLSLIGASIVFLVVIFIYNKWQEHRARKSVDRVFSDKHDDVLMNADELREANLRRQEPQFDAEQESRFEDDSDKNQVDSSSDFSNSSSSSSSFSSSSSSNTVQSHTEYATPSTNDGANENSIDEFSQNQFASENADNNESDNLVNTPYAANLPTAPIKKELSVDELIDCVIPLEFETPQRGDKLLGEISEVRFVGKKPVHFIGLNQDGVLAEIGHGNVYATLFAGVQMVNRSGPLNELEYSEFVGKLRLIADRLGAHSDIPDMNRVMETSRELHQFVAEHDAQLSVNVIANGAPWDITTLLAALEKQGFDMRPDGRLSMSDGDNGNLFTLSTNVSVSETVTNKLTLLLDVPCVLPTLDAFGAMSACAKSLATRLGGIVVDDSHQPISKEAVAEIAAQVADFYGAMEEAQIPAGSRRAQRLFS